MIPPHPPGNLEACPYCSAPTMVRDASIVYGPCDYGLVLICSRFPACDAYVGMHPGTSVPKGTLADRELRAWRKRAHMVFDPLWQSGRMSRGRAYRHLAELLGVPAGEAHIAWFSIEKCQAVITVLTAAKEIAR